MLLPKTKLGPNPVNILSLIKKESGPASTYNKPELDL